MRIDCKCAHDLMFSRVLVLLRNMYTSLYQIGAALQYNTSDPVACFGSPLFSAN